jgi:Fic family protein
VTTIVRAAVIKEACRLTLHAGQKRSALESFSDRMRAWSDKQKKKNKKTKKK